VGERVEGGSAQSVCCRRERMDPGCKVVVEGAGRRLPVPVALVCAWRVHSAGAVQSEQVLSRDDGQAGRRLQREADQRPGHRLVGVDEVERTWSRVRSSSLCHHPTVVSLSWVPV